MNARLVKYSSGKTVEMEFAVGGARCTIGRDPGNAVQLPDLGISKRHAVVTYAESGWSIEDAGSKNGVFVNGKKRARANIKHGDRIKIGPIEFVFETTVPGEDRVPMHFIDLSPHAVERTIENIRPESEPGTG